MLKLAKLVVYKNEFKDLRLDNLMCNLDACLKSRPPNVKKFDAWASPPHECLKFSMDGAARLAGSWGRQVLGVLCNEKGNVLFMFSKHLSVKDSSEAAKVLVIMEAICIFPL